MQRHAEGRPLEERKIPSDTSREGWEEFQVWSGEGKVQSVPGHNKGVEGEGGGFRGREEVKDGGTVQLHNQDGSKHVWFRLFGCDKVRFASQLLSSGSVTTR